MLVLVWKSGRNDRLFAEGGPRQGNDCNQRPNMEDDMQWVQAELEPDLPATRSRMSGRLISEFPDSILEHAKELEGLGESYRWPGHLPAW